MVETFEGFIISEEKVNNEGEDFQDEVFLKYEDACEQYQILKAKIMEMVKSKAPERKRTAVRHSSLKLPSVEIQTFEGGFNKWPAFRDIFMAVVGNEPSVAPA